VQLSHRLGLGRAGVLDLLRLVEHQPATVHRRQRGDVAGDE
jgi:hypothetical protein